LIKFKHFPPQAGLYASVATSRIYAFLSVYGLEDGVLTIAGGIVITFTKEILTFITG